MTPSMIEDTLLRRARLSTTRLSPSLSSALHGLGAAYNAPTQPLMLPKLGSPHSPLPLIVGFAVAGIIFYRLESKQMEMSLSQIETANSPSLVNRFLSAARSEPAIRAPSSSMSPAHAEHGMSPSASSAYRRDWVREMLQVM
ncbi:MAG: hypothetical protein FE78DRAFT_351440 [Acidomyces sp. 'richmondensis']|nr:MAG: hypothetical protein FE78DRAFT_351440 [Acidomyces sp. 'richmondensis']